MAEHLNKTPHYYSKLLEEDPEIYYQELKSLFAEYPDTAKNIINDTSVYCTWYSPTVHCLFYLTGNLVTEPTCEFYGSRSSISEDDAIKIFNLLYRIGINFNVVNYYNQTIDDLINMSVDPFTGRTGNKNFIEYIKNHLNYNNNQP